MRKKEIFICDICNAEYDNEDDASHCESQGFSPLFSVGDIVFLRSSFGWFDGHSAWVSNPEARNRMGPVDQPCPNGNGNCFSDCCTYKFYYVITFIDAEGHRPRYHVYTNAMTGEWGYRSGWTYDENHYTPLKVAEPPTIVVEQSKELLGQKAEYLL